MSDIKYIEKATNTLIGQQNGVDYWPVAGDTYANNLIKWKIAEVHVSADIKCLVEKSVNSSYC
ncbi:MAG: hypothetical protein ACM3TR_10745 [Caulobacteraceae bacterium]